VLTPAENLRGIYGSDALVSHHHVIWMGDLNYRLDWGQQVRQCLWGFEQGQSSTLSASQLGNGVMVLPCCWEY
jgi:hypothetical protein